MLTLVLCHSSVKPKDLWKKALEEGQPLHWIFLAQDYSLFLKWSQILEPDFRLIPLKNVLPTTALILRKPFMDLITDLGKRYDSPAWWASRVSERNTMVSFLFLYCCYLAIIRNQMKETPGTLCIISESYALLESAADIAQKDGVPVKRVGRQTGIKEKMLFGARVLLRVLRVLAHGVRAKMTPVPAPPPSGECPSILIHTYVDEACLREDGSFDDRYFPGLCQWLEKNGYSVVTHPVLMNLKRSYSSAWAWFRENRQKFINPFSFYSFRDYVFAIREGWRASSMPEGAIALDGLNVTNLFRAEQKYYALDCLEELLSFRLPKRLSEAGVIIDAHIDVFENMIPEKLLILGFRRYLPHTKLVGFQHASLYPLHLCLFVTEGEAGFAPLPDRVVSNGEFFQQILIREGLPSAMTVSGPALRYAHLRHHGLKESKEQEEAVDIFVPLPLMTGDGAELLTKLLRAFDDLPDLKIALKPHPMSSEEAILKAAMVKKLPAHFLFVKGTMSDWLKRAKVAISVSSGTIIEVLAAGVPIIVVGREAAIDLNPLGFYHDLNKAFYSPGEIRGEALRLLSLSIKEKAEYRQRADEVLGQCFNPVTDEAMGAFLRGLVPTN